MKEINEKHHPFPLDEIQLVARITDENTLPNYDILLITQLLHKYLNLRASVFHGD